MAVQVLFVSDLVGQPTDSFSDDATHKAKDISSCTCAQQRRKFAWATMKSDQLLLICCLYSNAFLISVSKLITTEQVFDRFFLILAGNEDNH